MLLQNLRARIGARLNGDNEAGFTLIELLVVMLILGILAAIALPAFFNQKNKANDSQAKELAHSAQVAIETCGTESGTGAFTNCSEVELKKIEPSLNSAQKLTVTPGTATYTVAVEASTGNTFSITRTATGTTELKCTVPEKATDRGGCPSSGKW